ncbi:MAG: hypothetical protein EXS09_20300 [Gemmataceae bacterium]|nr:hypothetical protein [Gemmataceae bacterium]
MEEFARLTVISRKNEAEVDFKKRLIDFWTRMLRLWPAEYKRVYAEMARFDVQADRLARQYFVGSEICNLLREELSSVLIDFLPIDVDDLFSKYEATPPEWFQIPH